MNVLKTTACCLALCVVAAQARGEIITPTNVTPSSEFAAAVNMINGSGLSPLGLHDHDENNMWQTFAGTSVGETAEFELDQNYNLSEAIIWQYTGPDANGDPQLDREVDEFELSVSSDLVSPFVSIGTFNLAPSFDQLSNVGEPAQLFALTGADDVRRVLFTINSVHGGVSDGFAGLSEVRFGGVVVPEPATFGLVGLCGVALLWLRRRRC